MGVYFFGRFFSINYFCFIKQVRDFMRATKPIRATKPKLYTKPTRKRVGKIAHKFVGRKLK